MTKSSRKEVIEQMSADNEPEYLQPAFLAEVRRLAEDSAQDPYFQGLVSSRLGNERKLSEDDELLDLVAGSEWMQATFNDLFGTPLGQARIDKAVQDNFKSRASDVTQHDLCRLVWELAAADPRFDLILKRALEEVKAPPEEVRGSPLSKIGTVIEKLRSALTSSAAKHSNAVLAGSVLAGLLAGSAATKLAPVIISGVGGPNSSGPSPNMGGVVAAINSLTAEVKNGNQELQHIAWLDERLNSLEAMIGTLQKKVENLDQSEDNLIALQTQMVNLQKSVGELRINEGKLDPATLNHIERRIDALESRMDALDPSLRDRPVDTINELELGLGQIQSELNRIELDLRTRQPRQVHDPVGKPLSADGNPTKGPNPTPLLKSALPTSTNSNSKNAVDTVLGSTVETDLWNIYQTMNSVAQAASALAPRRSGTLTFDQNHHSVTIDDVLASDGSRCYIQLTLAPEFSSRSAKFQVRSYRMPPPPPAATPQPVPCDLGLPLSPVTVNTNRLVLVRTQNGSQLESLDISLQSIGSAGLWPHRMNTVELSLYRNRIDISDSAR